MNKLLDQYFESKPSQDIYHPKIESWSYIIKAHPEPRPTCEIKRDMGGISFQPAKIYLKYTFGGKRKSDHDDWGSDLNEFLIQQKIRTVSEENEKVRFSLMLRTFFRKPEIRYGDGFFNAVLMKVVGDSFGENPVIKARINEIARSKPHQGQSYENCSRMIADALKICARDLLDLGYGRESAELILLGAMGQYLDERFSLVSLKRLGLAKNGEKT